MAWIYLLLAGVCEIGWPVGLKLGSFESVGRALWLGFAVACILVSGGLLLLAQREIPMGTAYAVWTGIGAAGAFVIGVLFFGDSASTVRVASVALIVAGVVGLKMG